MKFKIHQGDSAQVLKNYPDNHFDSIVTDPPYGIEFLGKDWDKHTGTNELYRECLRVLKPGGYILAFSAARTYHRLAATIEDAGFEIKDQLMWLYSSGFPKAQDIGKMIDKAAGKSDPNFAKTTATIPTVAEDGVRPRNRCEKCDRGPGHIAVCTEEPCARKWVSQTDDGAQWAGWKTALKPAHEPIVMARKPTKLSFAKNVQKYGTGALNIDATRIEYEPGTEIKDSTMGNIANMNAEHNANEGLDDSLDTTWEASKIGRYPSNVIGEVTGYQKYFYNPKVSRKERHLGFEENETLKEAVESVGGTYLTNEAILPGIGMIKDHGIRAEVEKIRKAQGITTVNVGNNHPTVKPINLMAYLVRLVTPKGGTVLDPFNGSGSTGLGCVKEGTNYVGIDLDQRYVDISTTRITAYLEELEKGALPEDLFGE